MTSLAVGYLSEEDLMAEIHDDAGVQDGIPTTETLSAGDSRPNLTHLNRFRP